MISMSFKTRLQIYMTACAVISLLLLGVLSYQTVYKAQLSQLGHDLEKQLEAQGRRMEERMVSAYENLDSIAGTAAYLMKENDMSPKAYEESLASNPILNGAIHIEKIENPDVALSGLALSPVEMGYEMTEASTQWLLAPSQDGNGYILASVNRFTEVRDGTLTFMVAYVSLPKSAITESGVQGEKNSEVSLSIRSKGMPRGHYASDLGYGERDSAIAFSQFTEIDGKRHHTFAYDFRDIPMRMTVVSSMQAYDLAFDLVRAKYTAVILLLSFITVSIALAYAAQAYMPVDRIRDKARELVDGSLSVRIHLKREGFFTPIITSFNDVAELAEEQYDKCGVQTKDIYDKQVALMAANQELEQNNRALRSKNKELQYSRSRYEILISSINDIVWVIDESGVISYINDAVTSRLGANPKELVGTYFTDLLQEEPGASGILEQFFQTDTADIYLRFKRQADQTYEVMITATTRIFENGKLTGIQGVSRPVSESWLLMQKLTRRSQAVEDIRHITRSLATEKKLEKLFGLIAKKINELYEVLVCSIWVVGASGELVMVSATGAEACSHLSNKISNPNDLRFKALRENKMIYAEDCDDNIMEMFEGAEAMKAKVRAVVVLPLAESGDQTGVISIALEERLPQNELLVLSTISIQSTLAIKKAQLYEKQREEFLATVRVLVTAIEAKDTYTEGHSYRVSEFAVLIGAELGLSSQHMEELQFAGMLHDIGKIGIDDAILTKKGRLSPLESDKIKEHPAIGQRILQPIGFSRMIMDGVTLHHKRYDLKGYPESAIDSLPLAAAIIGVSDALDAMTSKRTYSEGRKLSEAMEEIVLHKGSQFAPDVVEAILRIYEREPERLQDIVSGKAQVMS